MHKKKVAIIGTNGIPPKYGGFETLAFNLIENLSGKYNFIVYCSKIHNSRLESNHSLRLIYLPFYANGKQSIIYDAISIIHAFIFSDILLVLGPNSAGFMLFFNSIFKKRIVVNYGGIEWKRDYLSKLGQKYARFNFKMACNYSHSNIVDNIVIGNELIKDFEVETFETIAYGGNHVCPLENIDPIEYKYPFLREEYVFSIGRSQVDNNQHLVLDAFSNMPDKKFVIISNWDYNAYGRNLKIKYSNFPNIIMLDTIYNQNILDTIRSNCDVYIHSHSQCGTAPSLVEAMYLKLPIISFDVPTNRSTTQDMAYYFKAKNELIDIVYNLNKEDKKKLKDLMYSIALDRFTWEKIAKKYDHCFKSALNT